jgi:hypothetical protein
MLFDIPPTLVVPTVCVNDRIFFVGELLQQSDGTYFIPERFFYRLPKGVKLSGNPSISDLIEYGDSPPIYEPSMHDLWSLGRKVERTDVCAFTFHVDRLLITFSSRLASLSLMRRRAFALNFSSAHFPTFNPISKNLRVVSQVRLMTTPNATLIFVFSESSGEYGSLMPHPLRARSDGRMVYTVPVIVFMDDASGNISKQWNKHIVVYLSNAGLPREMLDKEFCTRFVTSSPNASPMELMRAVRDSME